MRYFKNRKNKKIEKYIINLKSKNVDDNEIKKLVSIFKKMTTLSNILIFEICTIVLAAVLLFLFLIIKQNSNDTSFNSTLETYWKQILTIFSAIFSITALISSVISLVFFIKVILTHSKYIYTLDKVLLGLTFIPFLKFIFTFIVKYRIKNIPKRI